MRQIRMAWEATAGANIWDAVAEVLDEAKRTNRYQSLWFNEVNLYIAPEDTVRDQVDRYREKCGSWSAR